MVSIPTSSGQYSNAPIPTHFGNSSNNQSATERQPLLSSGDKVVDGPKLSKVRKMMHKIGIVFAFLGMILLLFAIFLLIPTAAYNVFISIKTLCELVRLEFGRTGDWAHFSCEAILYAVYYIGAAVTSIAVLSLLFGICLHNCCSGKTDYLEVGYEFEHRRRRVPGVLFCTVVFLHLGWTIYGLVLLFGLKLDTHTLPSNLDQTTKLSVAAMIYNYLLLLLVCLIWLCAAVFMSLFRKEEPRTVNDAPVTRQRDSDLYSFVSVEAL